MRPGGIPDISTGIRPFRHPDDHWFGFDAGAHIFMPMTGGEPARPTTRWPTRNGRGGLHPLGDGRRLTCRDERDHRP